MSDSTLDTKTEKIPQRQDSKIGMGGWLILFQILIYFALLNRLRLSMSSIRNLIQIGLDSRFFWRGLINNGCVVFLYILVLVRFYQKRISFRFVYLMICLVEAVHTFRLLKYYIGGTMHISVWLYDMGPFIIMAIVVILLYASKRVKNTFA